MDKLVSANKRSADGELFSKQARSVSMILDGILMPSVLGQTKTQILLKSAQGEFRKQKAKKVRKKDVNGSKKESGDRYDVVRSLTNAVSGLFFTKIFWEEAVSIQKELQKLFGKALFVGKKTLQKEQIVSSK